MISKEEVPDSVTFMMSIDPLRYYSKLEENDIDHYTLSQLNDSTYLYMDKVDIQIPKKLQEYFIKKINNKIYFRVKFQFVNAKRI